MNTIEYYNENAKYYFDKTIHTNMSKQYEMFLKYVKENGKILDFGCGSGRDTLYFKNMGYDVDAIDGSIELCKLASNYTGIDVKCMDFKDFNAKDLYDGVWACSSILHVKRDELLDILKSIRDSLKEQGVFYTSFVDGYDKEEYKADGRYFNDLSKDNFFNLSQNAGSDIVEFSINRSKVSAHNADNHEAVFWNSFILKRR